MNNDGNYNFYKQFMITTDPSSIRRENLLSKWLKINFADNLCIFYHPALAMAHATSAQGEVLCMGQLLDPANPTYSNESIVLSLIREVDDFHALEDRLAKMAGRWVIIARFGKASFVYHDAGGLKSVFLYNDDKRGLTCIASQPSLFARIFSLQRHNDRDAEMHRIGASQWPIYIHPYDNIQQLLPNHRLNLSNYEIERYWPRRPLPRVAMEEAATEIFSYINGIISAASKRASCSMALTAGYDSRLLFACTKEFKDNIGYFTVKSPGTPRHDIVIPKKLANIWHVKHDVIDFMEGDADVLRVLRTNSSGLYIHPNYGDVLSKAKYVRDGLHLEGSVSEVMRCFYYKDGRHPDLSVAELARRTGFKDGRLAQQGLSIWLNNMPQSNVLPLDLLYWEQRLGVWASASYTFREALVENCPPINCRHILETGLGVDLEYRREPYQLYRHMYRMADKRLLKPEFNTTKQELIAAALGRLPIPWRLKKALGWV